MTAYNTAEVAAYIVELTQHTPPTERSRETYALAIERKFPGLDLDQRQAWSFWATVHASVALKSGSGQP